jgi:hypothetical protein
MKISIIFNLMLLAHCLSAQDLTGTWEGSGTMGTKYVKLVIIKTGANYSGYTYDEGMGYCKANFLGTFDSSSKKLKGKGMGFIEIKGLHIQSVYNLNYFFTNGTHFLRGNAWPKSVATKILNFGMPITITLSKTSDKTDTTDFIRQQLAKIKMQPDESNTDSVLNAISALDQIGETILAVKQSREADTLQTIVISEKKIKIKLFDNGVTDGDSVSVLYNDVPVVINMAVSAKALEFELTLNDKIKYHTITLVAHNLGSIPPNTATVLIEAGGKNYRINASSDYKKNAVIVIKYSE